MIKFEKPGRRENFDYPDMAKESVSKALEDAKINYAEVKQAVVSYVYGESTSGQRALYQFGMTGIPIYNVKYVIKIHCYRFNKDLIILATMDAQVQQD